MSYLDSYIKKLELRLVEEDLDDKEKEIIKQIIEDLKDIQDEVYCDEAWNSWRE